jgi:peptidoglycan-associated lipoprotein
MAAGKSGARLALATAMALGLALSACARHNPDSDLAAAGVGYGSAGPGSVQEFNQTVGDRVFFDTDQTNLSPAAQATLDKQAVWLNRYNRYSFIIEGHADERGTREYNFALGAQRAQAVRDYLVAKGVSPARMRTISYGKERPVAVCDDM